jgi:hypothetical protein
VDLGYWRDANAGGKIPFELRAQRIGHARLNLEVGCRRLDGIKAEIDGAHHIEEMPSGVGPSGFGSVLEFRKIMESVPSLGKQDRAVFICGGLQLSYFKKIE